MRDIKSIDIIFENCDYIKINREDIINLFLGNITKEIGLFTNSVLEMYVANEFNLEIKNIKRKTVFEVDLIRQLEYRNITSIGIYYTDETEEIIYCKWKGNSEFTNELQKNTINNDFIKISIEDLLEKGAEE